METDARQFDLNIERVLEHWTVAHALREIIANALDEHTLTATAKPQIFKDGSGFWHIRDSGRGLQYEDLTQNENKEKLQHPEVVIGKFGVGLKDALATFDRHQVKVMIRSRHGDITIEKRHKHGFDEITTLHAIITAPSDPNLVGTDVVLVGVKDDDIGKAKNFFLHYSGDQSLEQTRYGEVLQKVGKTARIYVNGLCVAEEENFLFSYNITSHTAALRKALNRERSNVGRGAYTDRVKALLLECSGPLVAEALAQDLKHFVTGKMHDEVQWIDVSLHACKILNAREKVIFLTPDQFGGRSSLVVYAQADGYRVIVVPDSIASKLSKLQDVQGQPIRDLNEYRTEWESTFQFQYVLPDQLHPEEQRIFALMGPIFKLTGEERIHAKVKQVLISETMRLDRYDREACGVWIPEHSQIVIRRDQLQNAQRFAGTLLHELAHALTGADDFSLGFENGLTALLGVIAATALTFTGADLADEEAQVGSFSSSQIRSTFQI